MDNFTIYNYKQLAAKQKAEFNEALAQELSSMMDEIKSNRDINHKAIEEFVTTFGHCSNSEVIVEDLYSLISSGIQSGSGDQNLFLGILAKYTECCGKICKQI